MKKIFFVFILAIGFNLAVVAQQTLQVFTVKIENGIAVVYNNGNKTFAVCC